LRRKRFQSKRSGGPGSGLYTAYFDRPIVVRIHALFVVVT
jgi:hypothetical protein